MRRLWFLSLLLALAACRERAPADGAVRVSITYSSYTPACLRVSASDAQGNLAETDIPRSAFKRPDERQVTVAVFRKPEWARELSMEVVSYEGSTDGSCSGTVLERHRSPEPVAVPLGDFSTFDVALLARDDDQDTYILRAAEVAGTDCDDTLATVHPGQPELCGGTVDVDCDGHVGCADTECLEQACDDHDPCTLNDQCKPGAGSTAECVGTPRACEPPNLTCYTGESVCNPATGACVHTQRPPDQPCDDEDACTTGDQCGLDASCKGTPSVQCDSPPNTVCYESAGVCVAATGTCSYQPKAPTATCDDANACTRNDRCNGSGSCAGEPLAQCVPSDACHRSERSCPASADCVESVDTSKVNMPCTTAIRSGVCRLDGVCSSFPYLPSNFDPDSIPEEDRGVDVHIDCGSSADPAIFDSGTLAWTAASGCMLPPMPTATLVGEIALVPIRNLTIDSTRALKLRGTRPVILAVYGSAALSGALLADADMEVPGAGGDRASCGTQRGGDGAFSNGEGSGGGGGGFGTAGAPGGQNNAGDPGGMGGVVGANTLVPLVGGCPGGTGGSTLNGGAGGGGGGALQVSVAGTLQVNHWISVSGGGARGGRRTTGNAGAGGGGGSAGGLLLEAFRLELTAQARLTANGGSGAEGGDSGGGTGSDGVDGSQSSRTPAHCPDQGGDGAPGGDGGADGVSPGLSNNARNNSGAGGGGGAVGIIQLRGFGGCGIDASCNATDDTGCDISPKVTPVCG